MNVQIEKVTTIIIEQGPDFFIVKCGHCVGSGQAYPGYGPTNSDRRHPCPTCAGIGFKRLPVPNDLKGGAIGLLKCAHCSGTGQKYPGYGDTNSYRVPQCPTCAGVGVLVRGFPRLVCSHCTGTGQMYPGYDGTNSYRESPCLTCKGAGSNWIGDLK